VGAEGGAVIGTAVLPGVGTIAGAVIGAAIGTAGGILAGRWLMGRSDNNIPLVGQPPNSTIVKPGRVVRIGPNGNATSRTCGQAGHGCEGPHTHDYVTGPNGKVNQKGKPRPATPEETAEVEATKPPPKPEPEDQR
jgi:hypothetical protein